MSRASEVFRDTYSKQEGTRREVKGFQKGGGALYLHGRASGLSVTLKFGGNRNVGVSSNVRVLHIAL
jgi:hypothetical protein